MRWPNRKSGNVVKVGQVWADCDRRFSGRFILVLSLSTPSGTMATCQVCTADGTTLSARKTTIAVSRMFPHSTGYRLEKDVA